MNIIFLIYFLKKIKNIKNTLFQYLMPKKGPFGCSFVLSYRCVTMLSPRVKFITQVTFAHLKIFIYIPLCEYTSLG